MNFLNNLEEKTIYEVLIATDNKDGTCNIKPFGIKYENNHFTLNLFPNKTLLNIKNNKHFTLIFTQDSLLFTKSLFGFLSTDDLKKTYYSSVLCEVVKFSDKTIIDNYGENITTTIMANPVKILEDKKTMPLINRATTNIIELLVEFSRYDFMDVDSKNNFIKKLDSTENLIKKIGNKKHYKSIELIKKELNEE